MAAIRIRIRSRRPLRGESGATSVEYGIMVAFIAAVIVLAVSTLGGEVSSLFHKVASLWP